MDGKQLLEDILKESREHITTTGLRFSGVDEEQIKEVFKQHGILYDPPF